MKRIVPSVRSITSAARARIEDGLGDVEACEELGRRTAHGRCEQQRRSRCRRQLVEACANQSLERLRNTQRLRGVDVRAQSPGELERVERVPTGRLVHAQEGRACERQPEVCLEKLVNGTEAQRADVQPLHAVVTDRPLEVRRLRTFAEATGEQQEDRPIAQPPQREGERARRGRIEPLDVVDREDNRPLGSENLERTPNRDTERARVEAVRIFLDEECHLERVAPGRRQRRQHVLEHVLEQVAEAGVCQPSFRFSRPRNEDTEASFAGRLDTRKPQRRLPDARLALEHERRRSVGGPVEEGVDGGKLDLPAHDVG